VAAPAQVSEPAPAASAPPPPVAASAFTAEHGSSVPPWEDLPPEAHALPLTCPSPVVPPPVQAAMPAQAEPTPMPAPSMPPREAPPAVVAIPDEALPETVDWHALQEQVGLGGFNLQLAQHSELLEVAGNCFRLRLANDQRHLLQINKSGAEKLQEALSNHFGRPVRVSIEVGEIATETPAQRNQADKAVRHAAALASLEQDPFVRELIERFDATLEAASVKPL
ncbi:DNA polymerase III subunit gamma/tau C-terminal domain-containing protein, partial [Zoogloea sp.]|uniref:DNA polymerase III subunit gamma/tau C-terminal domain-containing protein n=1 Tax=Zoogloea sp. TaxID=49181 RepID=UPI001ACC12F8